MLPGWFSTLPQPDATLRRTRNLRCFCGRGCFRAHRRRPKGRILAFCANPGEHRSPDSRRSERGAGTIKAILWTIILVYGAFAAYKIIPAYVAEYQLADKMQEQARFAVVNRYSEDQIRDNVFKVVQDLDIPVTREEIKIVDTTSVVKISMEYTIPVDLLVYHLDLHFTPASENKDL
jgi:hypothetical protein